MRFLPIAYILFWALAYVLCWMLTFDAVDAKRLHERLRDVRCAAVTAFAALSGFILYRECTGAFGPITLSVRTLAETCSYQTLLDWARCAALHLVVCAGAGLVLRALFGTQARPIVFDRRALGKAWRHGGSRRGAVEFPVVGRKTAAWVLLWVSAAALGLALLAWQGGNGAQAVCLDAVCRKQTGVEENISYVVLRNTGRMTNAPRILYLSDDPDDLARVRITGADIAPDGSQRFDFDADAFVSIRREGGTELYLSDAYGRVLDSVLLPAMPDDTIYLLAPDGWTLRTLSGDAPDTAVPDAPEFSAEGGFYDAPFDLELSAWPGTQIYYTLDGSDPDETSALYTGPIHIYDTSTEANRYRSVRNVREDYMSRSPIGQEPVEKAMVVRAVAVDEQGRSGPTATRSYWVSKDALRTRDVVSLTADPDALFGDDGIYVTGGEYDAWYARKLAAEEAGQDFAERAPTPNFLKHGAEWERAGNLELYFGGVVQTNQPVGLRVQGNTSRLDPLKRFSVYSRKIYSGSRVLDSAVFPPYDTHSFTLRPGFENAFSHVVVPDRDFAVLGSRPVTVFLNGEFWYDAFLQERYSATFFAERYGIEKDDLELVQIGLWNNASGEAKNTYQSLLNTVRDVDLSDPAAYAELNGIIDIQSFIDYACVQVYLGNSDSNEKLNTCIWRTRIDEFSPFGDGRWRWAMYDMDLKRDDAVRYNGYDVSAQINTFRDVCHDDAVTWPALLEGGVLWESLKASPDFCRQFVLTFMDLVNTYFTPDRMEALLADWGKDLSYDDWFFRDRAGYITQYLSEEFGLTGSQETLTLTCDPEAGSIRLNTVAPELSSGSWSGVYFTDYPVRLTAVAADGRTFDHWEVDGQTFTDPEIEITLHEGGSTAHAFFK